MINDSRLLCSLSFQWRWLLMFKYFENFYWIVCRKLLIYKIQRRSILVRSAVYQEGPKNPLKGISLKPLVFALNAQFGVDAGGKCCQGNLQHLRFQGARQWHGDPDPVNAETCSCASRFQAVRTHSWQSSYESGLNLYCGALGNDFPGESLEL